MNTNDLNTALYEKMAAEQDKYRDWLKSQPPDFKSPTIVMFRFDREPCVL